MDLDKHMDKYLAETSCIDFSAPVIQERVKKLRQESDSTLDYIEKAYLFVMDTIPHSWDIKAETVSRKASEVLLNNTGICWTKSCLLAALLRANDIPSGISYQRLTRADEEILAFPIRCEHGEVDYRDNHPDLDERLIEILENSKSILEITTDFDMSDVESGKESCNESKI